MKKKYLNPTIKNPYCDVQEKIEKWKELKEEAQVKISEEKYLEAKKIYDEALEGNTCSILTTSIFEKVKKNFYNFLKFRIC